jgi:hypothetical protein
VFDSSGPDGKVRGTPQQIIEKYNQLYRDSQLSNDRVNAENFAQHAEHYTRLQAEAQREVDSKREEQETQNRERQAERDRERNDRLKAQEVAGNDPSSTAQPSANQQSQQPHSQQSESRQPQSQQPEPQVMDVVDEADSGLVETPEEKPKPARKPRAPRKPRPAPDEGGTPEAAE